jgi:hypothetical protein
VLAMLAILEVPPGLTFTIFDLTLMFVLTLESDAFSEGGIHMTSITTDA